MSCSTVNTRIMHTRKH